MGVTDAFTRSLKQSLTHPGACKACGLIRPIQFGKCTGCGTPVAQAATATQLIRTYTGGGMDRAFQREAARLATLGWTAGTPAYSGTRGPGVARIALFGVFAFARGRQARSMTVIYTRPAPAA